MSRIHVNVDNFVRAETHRMMAALQADAGGPNRFAHNRAPADVHHQTVIRLNRDTLYSFAVVDLLDGATLTLPDPGDRYLSVMVVNEDHFINQVIHESGQHRLTAEAAGSRYAVVAVRILVDPRDLDDLALVAALQDQCELDVQRSEPFVSPDYDTPSFDETRNGLLALARGLTAFDHTFGARDEVDDVRHLIGTAAGWGGLPTSEASYIGVDPRLPVGEYALTVGDVPVDGFWSISVYNARGFFEPNELDAYSVNSVTAIRNTDGSVTVNFGGEGDDDRPNVLPVVEGWNYIVRLYRPRAEVLDGSWVFPSITA